MKFSHCRGGHSGWVGDCQQAGRVEWQTSSAAGDNWILVTLLKRQQTNIAAGDDDAVVSRLTEPHSGRSVWSVLDDRSSAAAEWTQSGQTPRHTGSIHHADLLLTLTLAHDRPPTRSSAPTRRDVATAGQHTPSTPCVFN